MEVSFAAHGVGLPAPGFADTHAVRELRQRAVEDPRLVECAIAHAIEQALQPRYDGLKTFFDPDALGEHLAEVATAGLLPQAHGRDDRHVVDCADDHGRWRVGRQRFADIEEWLRAIVERREAPRTHEEIVDRARERGLDLGDGNPKAQHAYLASLPWVHFRDDRQRALLVGNGDRAAPRVLAAASAVAGPGEPSEQLAKASAVALAWQDNEMPKLLLPHLVPAVPDAKEAPRGD
jgi:hypothetical protein